MFLIASFPSRAGAHAGNGMKDGACLILPGPPSLGTVDQRSQSHTAYSKQKTPSPTKLVSVYINQSTQLMMK